MHPYCSFELCEAYEHSAEWENDQEGGSHDPSMSFDEFRYQVQVFEYNLTRGKTCKGCCEGYQQLDFGDSNSSFFADGLIYNVPIRNHVSAAAEGFRAILR